DSPRRYKVGGHSEHVRILRWSTNMLSLRWPASHLARVLLVCLPLAGIFTLITVGPDYRHKISGGEPAAAGAPAVQRPANQSTSLENQTRNNARLADLVTISKAMTEFGRAKGSYPSTNGSLQTLCTYETIDVGCALK